MNIDDIPSTKAISYPESVSIKLSTDAFNYLRDLKYKQKKDSSALLRMLLEDFIRKNPIDTAA